MRFLFVFVLALAVVIAEDNVEEVKEEVKEGEAQTDGVVKDLEGIKNATDFIEENIDNVAVVGFFSDQESDEAKAFKEVAEEMKDKHGFGITSCKFIFSGFEAANPSVILWRKDDYRNRVDLKEGEFNKESIKSFIEDQAVQLVFNLYRENVRDVFGNKDVKNHFVFVEDFRASKHDSNVIMLNRIAKDFKGKIMFERLDPYPEKNHQGMEILGVKEEDVPAMRIVVAPPEGQKQLIKYVAEDKTVEEENIRRFIQEFMEGKLSVFYKSDDVPEDWDAQPVKVLVGKNFDQVAMDKDKHVLVEFYAPWCGHCKKLAPTWEALSEKYAAVEDLVIAKIDVTANEIPDINIKGFPTIKLFRKGDNKELDFRQEGLERSMEGFDKFLQKYVPSVKKEETKESDEKKDEL